MPDIIEEWKPVFGWEAVYEVSSFGQIRRIAHARTRRAGRLLKPCPDFYGYPIVTLSKNAVYKTFKVHILLMLTFVGPRPKDHDINHIDGIKSNNHLSNLEYVTKARNNEHAWELGLSKPSRAKISRAIADEIRSIGSTETHAELAARYGVSRPTISLILGRKIWVKC